MYITEATQFLFISSILYTIFLVLNFTLKLYGRIKLNKETTLILKSNEKMLLLFAIAYILSYLI